MTCASKMYMYTDFITRIYVKLYKCFLQVQSQFKRVSFNEFLFRPGVLTNAQFQYKNSETKREFTEATWNNISDQIIGIYITVHLYVQTCSTLSVGLPTDPI